jgi:hypothetical protein
MAKLLTPDMQPSIGWIEHSARDLADSRDAMGITVSIENV